METKIIENKIIIALDKSELTFLCNAMNETLEAIEEWEFQMRTGETPQRAKDILNICRKALEDAAGR